MQGIARRRAARGRKADQRTCRRRAQGRAAPEKRQVQDDGRGRQGGDRHKTGGAVAQDGWQDLAHRGLDQPRGEQRQGGRHRDRQQPGPDNGARPGRMQGQHQGGQQIGARPGQQQEQPGCQTRPLPGSTRPPARLTAAVAAGQRPGGGSGRRWIGGRSFHPLDQMGKVPHRPVQRHANGAGGHAQACGGILGAVALQVDGAHQGGGARVDQAQHLVGIARGQGCGTGFGDQNPGHILQRQMQAMPALAEGVDDLVAGHGVKSQPHGRRSVPTAAFEVDGQ